MLRWILMLSLGMSCLVPVQAKDSQADESLYSSFGKRDPFRLPNVDSFGDGSGELSPIRRYRLEGYALRAILRIGGKPQAMFEDPDGKSHVVVEGDLIGLEGAKVSRIVNSEVIVTEKSVNHLGKQTLLERVIALVEAPSGAGAPTEVQQTYSGSPAMQPSASMPQGASSVAQPTQTGLLPAPSAQSETSGPQSPPPMQPDKGAQP